MNIKLICDDCLIEMPKIADKSIDMILCDLPYGTTACKWDTIIPFDLLWKQYERIIKENGAILLTATQPFSSALAMSNQKLFKYEWIWEKSRPGGFLDSKKKPLKKHENILVFYKKLPKYTPQGIILKDKPNKCAKHGQIYAHNNLNFIIKESYTNYPTSILKFNSCSDKFHPTQKPLALFEYLIKTYTNEGDLVLDNCAGSGTTGVACKNLNRNCILIEKDEGYFKIIKERINNTKVKRKLVIRRGL